ncbi:MAG: hypothetical protein GX102_13245 [Porphyromonadaceae bacterium]|nr:hypothetical protein [Porphyromonadaceae bacterium]
MNQTRLYYEPDPVFTIEREFDLESKYALPLYQAQPYGLTSMYRGTYKCLFNQLVIDSGEIFYIDDAKSIISETKYHQFQLTPSGNLVFSMDYYLANSVEYKLLCLFNENKNDCSKVGLNAFIEQTPIFETEQEADEFIGYVELNIQGVLTEVEESSEMKFEDAPYDPRKHDQFRIHTGRVLKKLHHGFQLNDLGIS